MTGDAGGTLWTTTTAVIRSLPSKYLCQTSNQRQLLETCHSADKGLIWILFLLFRRYSFEHSCLKISYGFGGTKKNLRNTHRIAPRWIRQVALPFTLHSGNSKLVGFKSSKQPIFGFCCSSLQPLQTLWDLSGSNEIRHFIHETRKASGRATCRQTVCLLVLGFYSIF